MASAESDVLGEEVGTTRTEPWPLKLLKPLVDWVARRNATVHIKLLVGFLSIAVLLLALGILSIAVLNRVDRRVATLTALHDQTDLAQDMIYGVTAQSHFRAMSLITEIDSWEDKVYVAKEGFVSNLAALRATSISLRAGSDTDVEIFLDDVESISSRFETESVQVSDMYYAGQIRTALDSHIQVEHETSHELEDKLNGSSRRRMSWR